MSANDYQTGEAAGKYFYPDAGDPAPRKGARVQILTIGCVHTTGHYNPEDCIAWLPLPKRDRDKEEAALKVMRTRQATKASKLTHERIPR